MAATTLAAAALAGCSHGDHDTAAALVRAPSTTSSAGVPASPVPVPDVSTPTLPGAADAVQYFFELYGWGLQAGSVPAALRDLTGPGCEYCAGATARITRTAQLHRRVVGGTVAVAALTPAWAGAPDRADVGVVLTRRPSTVLDANGRTISREAGDTCDASVSLRWDGAGWRVLSVR